MSMVSKSNSSLSKAELIRRLEAAEEKLRAIQNGEVDALIAVNNTLEQEIAEHKRAEEQLQYQAALLSNVNDAIIAADAHYHITVWNAAAESLYGWKAEEVLGRNGLEIIHTEWPERDADEMRRTIAETGCWRGEATQLRRDGTRFPVEVSSLVLRDESGQIIGYVSVNRDITERKHIEAALHANQARLETLFSAIPGFVVEYDADGNAVRANDIALNALGATTLDFTRDDVAAKLHMRNLNRSSVNKQDWPTSRALRGERVAGEIYLITAADGVDRTVSVFTAPLITEGKVNGAVALLHDITDLKRAEGALQDANDELATTAEELHLQNDELLHADAALREANEKLKIQAAAMEAQAQDLQAVNQELEASRLAALNVLEDAVTAHEKVQQINLMLRRSEERLKRAQEIAHLGSWELDVISNQLTWSDEVYRIFGLQPQEFGATYESFLEAVHPDDRAAVDEAYSGSLRDGRDSYEIEHRVLRRPTGEIRIVHEKCEHHRDADGRLIRSVGMVHDITERKQVEEALRRNEALLRQTGEMARVGGWELDVQSMTLLWSLETYRIHEVEPSVEPCVEGAIDFYAPEARQTISDAVSRAINEGQAYDLELPFITARGRHLWIRTMGQAEFRDGKCARLFGAFQDITERKQAERRLIYLASFPERNPNPVIEVDFEGQVRYANPAASKWFPDLMEQGPAHPWLAGFDAIVDSIHEGETSIAPRDVSIGQSVYQQSLSLLAAERLIRIYGIDITRRKRAEEALRAAHAELEQRVQERTKELAIANEELSKEIAERIEIEQQLRIQTTAMEAAANGIVITDRHGNIQWTNPALAQISGYDPRDLLGQSTHIFSSGRQDATFYRELWDTILSGQVWRGEIINQREDGTLYPEEQTITPVRDANGEIPHFIAIKQDITDRKQAQKELEKRNEELRALSDAEHYQRQLSEALVKAALVLNQSLKLDEVLSIILEQIKGVIPYQLADVVFLEGETFYDASHQGDVPWPPGLTGVNNRFPVEQFPVFDRMCQSGEPVLILDTHADPEWMPIDGLTWIRSVLSAPLLVQEKVIGFVNLFSAEARFFTAEMRNRLVAFAAHASAAIQNAWLFERVQASTERLHSLSRRLVEVQEGERRYISRELHDEAGQMLTSLLVDLRLLEKNISEPAALQKIISEMECSLNSVIENLHRIAMALRPASLDHVGLVAALRQQTESIGEKNGLQVNFGASGVAERLPSNVETVLYRVVQEALTNVVRHSKASRVDVFLTVRDGKLVVIVEDDGIGFDPEAVSGDDHLGLFGMRERTEMIDGKLIIESAPGKGTTIMMEVAYADTNTGR